VDLLLLAGDLFHRQPLLRELKEVNYLFSKLSVTQVVMIVGNHDYLKKDSYYHTFVWAKNVHVILSEEISCVELPDIQTAVYGCSYHGREISGKPYAGAVAQKRQKHEILLLHGGDENHMPLRKEEILNLGYDYTALGHIHRPQEIVAGKMAFSGALEPTDKNDIGPHGFIMGEMTAKGCRYEFVVSAVREYKHVQVEVSKGMTGYALREKVRMIIEEMGTEHIYKIMLEGFKDPDVYFDLNALDVYGNAVEITDNTKPSYNMKKLLQQNKDNILGSLISEWGECPQDSAEYRALCEGVHALMETRRD
jgi:DNA repair exonuclease SbcCD nuclease subunit